VDLIIVAANPASIDHVESRHRPFHRAVGGRPSPSAASYAARRVTLSENTTTVISQPKEAMAKQSGQKLSIPFYAPQMVEESASTTTLWAHADALSQNANAPMSAPSAAQKIITLSRGYADLDPTPNNPFFSMTLPFLLPYRKFSDTIIHRPPLSTNNDFHNEIYNRIVQPYNPNAFETLLLQHDLTYLYPLLVTNLRNGFPLGEMPLLTKTVILENHPSVRQYPETIDQYLKDEIEAGRMDGPFSYDEIELILRGSFFVSPLIVSVQPQGFGMPDKLRVCRHLSKSNKLTASVNSHIKKEDFPTRFDTASRVADIVSFLICSLKTCLYYPEPFVCLSLMTIGYLMNNFFFLDIRLRLLFVTFMSILSFTGCMPKIGITSGNPSSALIAARASKGYF
jgi:hypothetical protein